MRINIILALVLSTSYLLVICQNIPSNCTNPIFTEDSFKARKQTRPRYLSAPANSTLNYCKVFSNKFSCCNKTTDEDIAAIFNNYKAVLANLTSKKFRSIKEGFEHYQNVSFNDLPNSDKAKEKVGKVLQDVKNRLTQTTKNAVACARHALKLSAGLLCSGCNPLWGNFVKAGKFVFSENSCLALSNACFGLLKGFENLKNESRADVSNLTDAIAEFVGVPFSTEDEKVLFDDSSSPARILQTQRPLQSIATACSDWASKGYIKETDCTICYKQGGMSDLIKKPECSDNILIKVAYQRVKKLVPDRGDDDIYSMASGYLQYFHTFSRYSAVPVNVKLDQNIVWQFYTTDTDFYEVVNRIFKLKNATAKAEIVADYNKKLTEELNSYFDHEEVLRMDEYSLEGLNTLTPEKKREKTCFIRAVDLLLSETGKKSFENLRFSVKMGGEMDGTISGDGAPSKKSNLTKFVTECNKGVFPEVLVPLYWLISTKDTMYSCVDMVCYIYKQSLPPVTPSPKSKQQILDSFQKMKASGKDPKRFSVSTGRRVPDEVILPNKTDVATEMTFTPPCANVSNCAKWFCNNFISGPLARVEKVINPQDSADALDSQASEAYNVQLNNSRRILADEAGNELSPTGLNFIAVAEASGLVTTVAIDGVQEEAAGFNSSIKANTTLDANSSGIVVNNNSSKNGTGNGSSKINIIMSVIISLFVLLI